MKKWKELETKKERKKEKKEKIGINFFGVKDYFFLQIKAKLGAF